MIGTEPALVLFSKYFYTAMFVFVEKDIKHYLVLLLFYICFDQDTVL